MRILSLLKSIPTDQMDTRTRIILLTMVKNEVRNVARLFNSVKPWIDGYVLCDTGSTDETVATTKQLIKDLNMPGAVIEFPWENFGKSRTRTFEAFADWVRNETEWSPEHTFGLLLDGDMILTDEGGLHEKLAALDQGIGGVNIPQKNGGLIYKNTRLVRASAPWKCIGATHEYWSCDGKQTGSFESPVITDIGDGGCKDDKYTRDARLLEEELATDPTNVRTNFYLGQTYMSLGRYADAIRVLTARIELKGWEEEIYIAHLYKGDCLKHLGRMEEAICEWIKGVQLRSHRTEAFMRLISYYRQSPNMNMIACIFIEKLIQLQYGETLEGHRLWKPVVNNDILFVSHTDMEYQIWEELGIIAYYVGRIEGAQVRLDRQIIARNLSFTQRNRMADLYRWYGWKIPVVKRVSLALPNDSVPFLAEGFWRGFNPCIRNEGDRYAVSMRNANYETKDAKHYSFRAHDGYVITRNTVMEIDSDLHLKKGNTPFELVVNPDWVINKTTNIHGIEDCRWINPSSLIATTRQFGQTDINRMIRVNIDRRAGTIVSMKPLKAPIPSEDGDCQKNWLPFMWNNEETYIYKINPFIVFTMKGKKLVHWAPGNGFTFDGLRGSAAPVPWTCASNAAETMLMVVHYSYYGNEGRRYYHRFLTLNNSLQPVRISKTFLLCDDAVQYVSGLAPSLAGGSYVMTYGVNDSQAWAVEVTADVVERSLVYTL